jgi:hypothetical protein
MLLGYELFAVRRSGHIVKYEVVAKRCIKQQRAALRKWANAQPTRYRIVCTPITE